MNRTGLINYLIKKNNYTSYLEIGLAEGLNYRQIQCEYKESVDPFIQKDHIRYDAQFIDTLPDGIANILTYRLTSDEFFAQNKKKYDIIFIDGLHEQYQVMKDVINALDAITERGVILVHDCLPESEEAQLVPRRQATWNGDVWKGVAELIKQGMIMKVIDTDYGIGIIRKTDNIDKVEFRPLVSTLTWQDYSENKAALLNIVSEKEFLKND